MVRPTRRCRRPLPFAALLITLLFAPSLRAADAPPAPAAAAPAAAAPAAPKAPPERTYSRAPFVHRIPILDEDGTVIRPTKPGEEPAPNATNKPMSQAQTCGKCHSDYPVMQQGWHFNFARPDAPHGRPGEPWILTDVQTRTQLPLSYRGWAGTFHPHDVGLNDFNFAKLFGRHHPGGGALQSSGDLRFKMSGPLENDCLICHTSDDRYDPVARANAIATDQNFKHAPTLAAFLGKVQGQASRLRDNFDPTGPDARRAPRVNYDPSRFDDAGNVVFNVERRVSNDRCYFCHTNFDVGRSAATSGGGGGGGGGASTQPAAAGGAGGAGDNAGLESRWRHDRDVHLVKGMQCVDCHRNGADHMIVRGYEGEFADRAAVAGAKPDPTITTLTCAGCHYGTETMAGGRNAAPRPLHRGMPTLHFDELTCTACHSGPMPEDATTIVQTAMAHKLGLPRHHTADAAAPIIQQPVFLREQKTGKIAPHRVLFASYWGRMANNVVTPLLPEQVRAAGADEVLGEAPDPKHFEPVEPLKEEQIAEVLAKLAAAAPPEPRPADVVTARGATTNPTTAPATAAAAAAAATTQPAGEPVFVTGGRIYKRKPDGKGLDVIDHGPTTGRYAWPLAHDVRPAQQSLGARGCVECHAAGAPVFDSKLSSAAVLPAATAAQPMHEVRGDSMGALRAFGATYPLRWPLIVIGYASAAVLLVVLLRQSINAIGGRRG